MSRARIASAPEVQALRDALVSGDTVLIAGLILQELLHGFAGPRERKGIVDRFAALPLPPPDRQDHNEAAAHCPLRVWRPRS